MSYTLVLLAVVLAVLAGVLVSIEAAISAFSRARAEELADSGAGGAKALSRLLEDPAPALNTVLLLRIFAETAAVVLVTLIVIDRGGRGAGPALVAMAVMTVVSFVAIGVGPRTLGRQHAERIAVRSASPVEFLTRLLGPIPRLLIVVGNALTPGKGFREGPFASEVEVRELVDLAAESSVIESDESRMIQSVFDLGDTLVREVMVPRPDLVFIERTKTLRQAMSLAFRSGYSRIPVIAESLDDVVGMAYLKDIAKRVHDNHDAETRERVESLCRECQFVPDTKRVGDLLREMQLQRTHVAIVVDEYGGTAGMVTIEDILEEIVGEIADEYDTEPSEREKLGGDTWRVSSRFDIDDLADLFGVRVEDDDVDTVGGLMAKHLGRVPLPGSVVEVAGLRFEAQVPTGRRNRIGRVDVSPVNSRR